MNQSPVAVIGGYARILIDTDSFDGGKVTLRHFLEGDVILPSELERIEAVWTLKCREVTIKDALERLQTQRERDDEILYRSCAYNLSKKLRPHLEWLHANTPRGYTTEDGLPAVRITQEHLAHDLHTERITVNRVLKRLESQGVVKRLYGGLALPPLPDTETV